MTIYIHVFYSAVVYTIYSSMYAIYSSMYAIHSSMYAIHSSMYAIHSSMYAIYSSMYAIYSSMYSIYSSLCIPYIRNSMYTITYVSCSVVWSLLANGTVIAWNPFTREKINSVSRERDMQYSQTKPVHDTIF